MDENEKRNEVAATIFSVLMGLAVLMLVAWATLGRSCSEKGGQLADGTNALLPAAAVDAGDDDADIDEAAQQAKVDAASAQGRIAELESEKSDLEDRVAELEAKGGDVAASGNANVAAAVDTSGFDAKINGLQGDLDAANAKINLANTERGNIQGKLDAALKTNADLEAQLKAQGDSADSLKALQVELDGAKKANADLQAKIDANADLSGKVDSLTAENDELKKQIKAGFEDAGAAAMAATAEKDKSLIADLKTKLADMTKGNETVTKERDGFKTQIADFTKKLDLANGERDAWKLKFEKADAEKPAMDDTQIKALTDENASLKAAATKMTNDSKERIAKLSADNKSLTAELAKLKANLAGMSSGSDEVKKLTADNKGLSEQIAALKAAAAKMGGDTEAKLAKLTADNKSLSDELAKLKAMATDKPAEDGEKVAALTKENGELKQEVSTLKKKIVTIENKDKLKAAAPGPGLDLPLLVNDPSNLDGELIPLFVELRGIADDPEARTATYSKIAEVGKASPVKTVKFESGSSAVQWNDQEELKKLMSDDDNAKYLVVGYASVDGDAGSNAVLSSKRASQVGQLIVGDRENNDRVQAVYFGQTNRFDKAYRSPNRVVEVWKVSE